MGLQPPPAVAPRAPRRGAARLPPLRGRVRLLALASAVALLAPTVACPAPTEAVSVVHTWRRVLYGNLDGKESLLFANGWERGKPALGDLDGDGDLDMIVGTAEGHLLYFENQGTPKQPRWRLVNEALTALPPGQGLPGEESPEVISVGANAVPALVDIDGDGDLDLFVGSASGKLFFYRNVGSRYLPLFRLESKDYLGRSFGQNLAPSFVDVNADGLPDLSLGNDAGEVWLLVNQGSRALPQFCAGAPDQAAEQDVSPPPSAPPPAAPCLTPPARLLQLADADNAVPQWVDWNQDGLPDLMVGKSDGTLDYYQNIGSRTRGTWELKQARFNILDSGAFADPVFADVDGDGLPDLLLAGAGEGVTLYRAQKGPKGLELWIASDNLLQARGLGGQDNRLRLTAGDLFGHGRQDLVVGSASGQLTLYENLGGDVPSFRTWPQPVLPDPLRGFSSPTLMDVDGDGRLDLIVGDRNGRLEYIRNIGSKNLPRWQDVGLFFGQIAVGSLSVPLAADVDGDGLTDLLVGNSRGQVVYYRNVGTRTDPAFQLMSTRFGGLTVPGGAAPALFQWNPKSPPDLVVGDQAGALLPSIRNPELPVTERKAYDPEGRPWAGLRAGTYSAPLFVNLTGSGQYLLLGTGSGHVLAWQYQGSVPAGQMAQARRPPGMNVVREGSNAFEVPGQQPGLAPAASRNVVSGAAPEPPLPLDPIFVPMDTPLSHLAVGRITKPAFLDFNGDGRPDLVVGNQLGQLLLFENLGPAAAPQWKLVTDRFAGFRQGTNAAPVFVDLDGDGDLDLVVGTAEGAVFYYENTGKPGHPQFVLRPEALRGVHVTANAVPAFANLEPDGPQLLLGSLRGALRFYRRTSRAPLDYALVERYLLGLDLGVNTSPAVGDLTAQHLPYVLVGTDAGPITVLEPTGTSQLHSSGWKVNTAYLAALPMPPGTHPVLVDLDGDGDPDLVVGTDKGPLLYYRNNAIAPEQTAQGEAR